MIAFSCPHCGGSVRYDLSGGAVKCEYCDGLIRQTDYEAYLDKKGLYQTTELCCPQCGSVVLSYKNTIATFCSYCGSSVMFDRRVREEQKPDGIVPFSVREQEAIDRFKDKTNRILLAPDWIHEEGRQEMTGIYMPFYVYKASCESPISVNGEKKRDLGRTTEVSVYQVDGTVRGVYEGNRFDAAVAFPDALSESIDTYQWEQSCSFSPAYVAGFYADGSDVDPQEYDPVMAQLVSDDINMTGSIRYDGMSLSLGGATQAENVTLGKKKMLMPVWLLTHRVRDRICYAAINGQNGDVAADIPLDRGKYLKVSVIVTALLASFFNVYLTIKPETFLWISMILTGVFGIVLGRLTQEVYIRENHLDDIGRMGYQAFAEAVKNAGEGRKKSRRKPLGCGSIAVYGVIFFFVWPSIYAILSEVLEDSLLVDLSVLIWPVLLTLGVIRFFSGVIRSFRGTRGTTPGRGGTKWVYSKSLAASFSVLWKVWLALAGGAVVLMSGTVLDPWYYGAGAANILVSVWAAFDVIRKQNMLASRDIPLFTMPRGGRE